MKTVFLRLACLLVIPFVLLSTAVPAAASTASTQEDLSAKYASATLEDDFENDCLLITIKHEYSVVNRIWTADQLGLSNVANIKDLTAIPEGYDDVFSDQDDFEQILKINLAVPGKEFVLFMVHEAIRSPYIDFVSPSFIFAIEEEKEDPYENIHVNTGDQSTDLIGVAKTQVGYIEGSLTGDVYNGDDNVQKYGAWYDENVDNIGAGKAAWNATFVAWCADQADIPDTIIPHYAYMPYSVSWYEGKGLFELAQSRGGTYSPKAGDLIYFAPAESTLASHMGIVVKVDDGLVYTVEGNTGGQSGEPELQGVFAKKYSLTYSRIYGYATPQYAVNPYANTHVNTGNGAVDLIGVAKTQIGYMEGSLTGDVYGNDDNVQKYGTWYDETFENIGAGKVAWEGSFVSWCANQAGIPLTVIPSAAYVPYSAIWYKDQGSFYASQARGGTYIPKAGDLIYFAPADSTLSSHMGIVTAVNGDYVYTIEGNTYAQSGEQTTQEVAEKKYMLNYIRIYGYATPRYELVFDITGDGQVSTSDARDLLMCVLNNSIQKKANMDVDKNGEINTADARELLMKVIQN